MTIKKLSSVICHQHGIAIWGKSESGLQKRGKYIPLTDDMIVAIDSLVEFRVVITEDMIVAVAQTLASAEQFRVDVTNDVLVAVS